MYCTKCGKEATQGDSFCVKCGAALASNQAALESGSQHETVVPYMLTQLKSEGTSIVLAFLLGLFGILGVAHIYLGRLEKGLVLFLVGVVCYGLFIAGLALFVGSGEEYEGWFQMSLVFGLVYIILWIWQIFNATTTCRDYNTLLLSDTGKRKPRTAEITHRPRTEQDAVQTRNYPESVLLALKRHNVAIDEVQPKEESIKCPVCHQQFNITVPKSWSIFSVHAHDGEARYDHKTSRGTYEFNVRCPNNHHIHVDWDFPVFSV
jgi:hypothetical protein